MYQYDFSLNVIPNDLQELLSAFAQAGWRLHSIWQHVPDTRQPSGMNEALALYDVLFEREVNI